MAGIFKQLNCKQNWQSMYLNAACDFSINWSMFLYDLWFGKESQGACINDHIIILHYCKSENYLGTQGKSHHLYQFSIS